MHPVSIVTPRPLSESSTREPSERRRTEGAAPRIGLPDEGHRGGGLRSSLDRTIDVSVLRGISNRTRGAVADFNYEWNGNRSCIVARYF